MSETSNRGSRRVLEPIDRISEALFGLIMALTFTCSFSVTAAERSEVHTMLLGAIGCNLAWGLVDGVMYMLTSLTERGRNLRIFRSVRQAASPEKHESSNPGESSGIAGR